jgi:hypothetical protein
MIPLAKSLIVVLANVYSDAHCEAPADTIVKLIIQQLTCSLSKTRPDSYYSRALQGEFLTSSISYPCRRG